MDPALDIAGAVALLAVGLLLAHRVRRRGTPYTLVLLLLGLAVGGLALGLLPGATTSGLGAALRPELFFAVLIPPIVFEAGLHLDAHELRRRAGLVLFLVFAGVLVTTAFTGYLVALVVGIPLAAALLLAAILSPTDPIAVVDLFRRLRVPRELATIVEAESLLNDAVGVIAFVAILGVVRAGAAAPVTVATTFLVLIVGGAAVGLAVAAGVHALRGRLGNPWLAVPVTVAASYGSYLVAAALGGSGILAATIVGIGYGSFSAPAASHAALRRAVDGFWREVVFVVNSVVFLALGLAVARIGIGGALGPILLVFALITAARALFVYAHRPLAARLAGGLRPLPAPWYHLIAAAGVRGAIPVVLALSLVADAPGLPASTVDLIVSTVLGVVLLSLLLNNLVATVYARRTFPEIAVPDPPTH